MSSIQCKLSVIISVNDGHFDQLIQTMNSVADQTLDKACYELILVNNGCSRSEYKKNFFYFSQSPLYHGVPIKVLHHQTKQDLLSAQTTGANYSRSDYLLILQPGVLLKNNLLDSVLVFLNSEPNIDYLYFLKKNKIETKGTLFSCTTECCYLIKRKFWTKPIDPSLLIQTHYFPNALKNKPIITQLKQYCKTLLKYCGLDGKPLLILKNYHSKIVSAIKQKDTNKQESQKGKQQPLYNGSNNKTISNRKLILHIGHTKTGTTYLQQLLSDNSDLLKRQSIYYPCNERSTAQHWLTALLMDNNQNIHDRAVYLSSQYQDFDYDKMLSELANCPHETILLSSEAMFASVISIDAFNKFLNKINVHIDNVHIIALIRRPDLHFESKLSEVQKRRIYRNRNATLRKKVQAFFFISLASILNKDNITIIPFEKATINKAGSLEQLFFNAAGINNDPDFRIPQRVNESLNYNAILFLQQYRDLIHASVIDEERAFLVNQLELYSKMHPNEFDFILPYEQRKEIYQTFMSSLNNEFTNVGLKPINFTDHTVKQGTEPNYTQLNNAQTEHILDFLDGLDIGNLVPEIRVLMNKVG